MNHGFGAPGDDAMAGDAVYHYHSIYDSERWMELYGDPGFFKHVCSSQFKRRRRNCSHTGIDIEGGCCETLGFDSSSIGRFHHPAFQSDTLCV